VRRLLPLVAVTIAAAVAPSGAAAAGECPATAATASRSAPPLRLGVNPAGEAGALGPAVPAVPERPRKTLAALRRLQPPGLPLALRLNRFFWSGGPALVRHFERLTRRYTRAGYLVELQLRYHPPAGHDGDVAGFVRWVRRQVRRFGANPRVTSVQVTNEVNLPISPDSSDGAYRHARAALIRGVIAARQEARSLHYGQLTVGFNWVYRWPADDAAFWATLRRGGPAFRRALDWVGLDAYPGTFMPPSLAPADAGPALVEAAAALRCFMAGARIGGAVPIHVEENGWPTGPRRPAAGQAAALRSMLPALDRARGRLGVTDYRWFDLRDHNSASANVQHHYGVLDDRYRPKPAFAVLRRLFRRYAAPPPGRIRVALRTTCRHGRTTARLTGPDRASLRRVDLKRGGRTVRRLDGAPWRARIRGSGPLSAVVAVADGRVARRTG
jgi:hypothetical protein